MRTGCSVALLVLAVLAAPAHAGAHLRIGSVAVDARVTIARPRPSHNGVLTVSIRESDRRLRITVRRGHRIVVLGYVGEKLLRVDDRGVAVNRASPTAAEAGLVPRHDSGRPGWSVTPGHTAIWRDPRVQRLPAGVNRIAWTVPILVDGRRAELAGELVHVPRPSLWPWMLVALGTAALGCALAVGRRPRRLQTGCIALGSASASAALLTAGAFAAGAAAPGTRVAAVYTLVLVAPAVGALVLGPPVARVPAAIWLAVIGLTATLVDTGMFFHGYLLSALPATLARASAALAIGAALGALALGWLYYEPPTRRS